MTLVEVLAAIFIMGIGLLALLTLFPLGALNMARALQDDRAASIAADAQSLGDAGEKLLARTRQFVIYSAINGSADPKAAAELKEDHEKLAASAADLKHRIQELRTQLPNLDPRIQRLFDLLIAEISAIEGGFSRIAELLGVLQQLP